MANNVTTLKPANTAPAMRSLQPPSWPQTLSDWLASNCFRREWNFNTHGCVKTFEPPETIPAEIRALVPEQIERYRAALSPANRRAVLAALARMAVHFPDSRSAAEWKILHEDYADALAEMPVDILAEAIRLYLLRGRFYPKLAEIVAEAQPLLIERRNELHALVGLNGIETPEERAERWEQERAERQAKRLAEIEARCQAEPHLRPFYTWAQTFRRHMNVIGWLPWLEDQIKDHSLELIESWHQQLADEQAATPWPKDFDAFARLRAIARPHQGGDIAW